MHSLCHTGKDSRLIIYCVSCKSGSRAQELCQSRGNRPRPSLILFGGGGGEKRCINTSQIASSTETTFQRSSSYRPKSALSGDHSPPPFTQRYIAGMQTFAYLSGVMGVGGHPTHFLWSRGSTVVMLLPMESTIIVGGGSVRAWPSLTPTQTGLEGFPGWHCL